MMPHKSRSHTCSCRTFTCRTKFFTSPVADQSLTMKFALVLLVALVAMASAHPRLARSEDKRFIVDTFKDIGHWFSHVWDSAKDEFNKIVHSVEGLASKIDFDGIVKVLVPLIDSDATEAGCSTVCVGAAASILGPAAPLAGTLCGPLCKAALAELQKVAG